jgi:hypothetical protein
MLRAGRLSAPDFHSAPHCKIRTHFGTFGFGDANRFSASGCRDYNEAARAFEFRPQQIPNGSIIIGDQYFSSLAKPLTSPRVRRGRRRHCIESPNGLMPAGHTMSYSSPIVPVFS